MALPTNHQQMREAAGALLYCLCDEASGVLVDDASGVDLTATGTPSSGPPLFGSYASGTAGSRYYDGSERHERSPVSGEAATIAGEVSVSCWVNLDNLSAAFQTPFSFGSTGSGSANNTLVEVDITSAGEIRWAWKHGSGTTVVNTTSGAGITAGKSYHLAFVREDEGATAAVHLYLNGALLQSWTGQTKPDGGTSCKWSVGGFVSGVYPITGYIGGIIAVPWAASAWMIREQYARGVQDFDLEEAFSRGLGTAYARVLIEDQDGGLVNMSSLDGKDFLRDVEIDDDNAKVDTVATVNLSAAVDELHIGKLMTSSHLNTGGTLLDWERRLIVEVAHVPTGSVRPAHDSPFWLLRFDGFVSNLEDDGTTIFIDAEGRKRPLNNTWVRPDTSGGAPIDREYGSPSGDPLEGVIQDVINDHEPVTGYKGGAITVYVPTATGAGADEFTVEPTLSVGQEVDNLAHLIGWVVRSLLDENRQEVRVTLSDVDRAGAWTSGDPELSEPQIIGLTPVTANADDIRNTIEIEWQLNSSTDDVGQVVRQYSTYTDAASVAKYGERYARISLESTARLNTQTEIDTLGNAALDDLSSPDTHVELTTPYAPHVERGGHLKTGADNRRWDAEQEGSVSRRVDRFGRDGAKSTIGFRFKPPSAGATLWIRDFVVMDGNVFGATHTPPARPAGTDAQGIAGGLVVQWNPPVNHGYRGVTRTEVHIGTSSGFTVNDASLAAVVDSNYAVIADLDPNNTYYVKVRHRDENNRAGETQTATVSGNPFFFNSIVPRGRSEITLSPSTTYGNTLARVNPSTSDSVESYDIGGAMNYGSWEYDVPVDGFWALRAFIALTASTTWIRIDVRVDAGAGFASVFDTGQIQGASAHTVDITLELNEGDLVQIYLASGTAARRIQAGSFFEMALVGQ